MVVGCTAAARGGSLVCTDSYMLVVSPAVDGLGGYSGGKVKLHV